VQMVMVREIAISNKARTFYGKLNFAKVGIG
jgi:hypothetical protein